MRLCSQLIRRLGVQMIARLLTATLIAGITIVTFGCERPFDRTPPGYAEACYGGKAAAAKNWVCSDDRLVVSVEGTEADWPILAKVVSDYGRSRGLEVFDTSVNTPNYIRALEISVCSSKGLFLLLDKRIYADQSLNRDGNRITAHLRTYNSSFKWKPLAEGLVADFRNSWHGSVEVAWPEPTGDKRILPDSVKSCDESAS
jgi:hypothetical protein